jgi:DNA-binding transcriptional ArsR family regulator
MTYKLTLTALADPTRRAVFERVIRSPRPVGEIARGLPISRPAVSQHLKVLREAGLVREQRQGTQRIYSADAAALGELRAYVDQMWQAALGKFAESANKDRGRKK